MLTPSLPNSDEDAKQLVLDIETTLDHKTIRLIGVKVLGGTRFDIFDSVEMFSEFLSSLSSRHKGMVVWTWNGARFDIPLLKAAGVDFSNCQLMDGMQLAQMYDHTFKRKSLDAWSQHMTGKEKSMLPEGFCYDTCPIPELKEYLEDDLDRTSETLVASLEKRGPLNPRCFKALRIEHKAAELCEEQVKHRVSFDVDRAVKLYQEIYEEMVEIERLLSSLLPVRPLPKSKLDTAPKVQFKKDGSVSANMFKWAGRNAVAILKDSEGWYLMDMGGDRIERMPFEGAWHTSARIKPSNMAEIKTWLLETGWVPTEWNMKEGKRTTPRLTLKGSGEPDPALLGMGITWMESYSEWLMLRSRKNVLHSDNGTGWLPMARDWNTDHGERSLPSDGDTMGANTSRWTHKIIANVPRVTSPYGEGMRACFTARKGMKMVGWDASALEARIEAHYCYPYDKEYAGELVTGDVHTRNLEALPSLETRDNAKTFKYAITYGAQAPRLASYFGWDRDYAEEVFSAFWMANPSLKEVRDRTIYEWEHNSKRFILGLDGRPIHTRSKHSLLNARFQSAGAIVMKYAMLIANQQISKLSLPANGLIRYHDEEQWECDPRIADSVGIRGADSIRHAGKVLGLRVPLDAEYKIGNNWAETH